MPNSVTVLVDADPLVYRVGFSLETRVWYVEWVDVDPKNRDEPHSDDVHIAKFYNAAARDRFIELRNLHPDEYASTLVPVPVSEERIVYGRVKQSLIDIQESLAEMARYMEAHAETVPAGVTVEHWEPGLYCSPERMEIMFAHLDSQYGGIEGFLESIGVTETQKQSIRNILLK